VALNKAQRKELMADIINKGRQKTGKTLTEAYVMLRLQEDYVISHAEKELIKKKLYHHWYFTLLRIYNRRFFARPGEPTYSQPGKAFLFIVMKSGEVHVNYRAKGTKQYTIIASIDTANNWYLLMNPIRSDLIPSSQLRRVHKLIASIGRVGKQLGYLPWIETVGKKHGTK
jgi:hypothetical protein